MWNHHPNNKLVKKLVEVVGPCTLCEKHNSKACAFVSTDSLVVDVCYIAQNPGASHLYGKDVPADERIPFGLNGAHKRYNRFFETVNSHFKAKDFYVTNIVKCATKDDKLNDLVMIENCVERFLLKELDILKSKNENLKIVVLGRPAREIFESQPQLCELNYVALHHPSYLNRQTRKYTQDYIKEKLEYVSA